MACAEMSRLQASANEFVGFSSEMLLTLSSSVRCSFSAPAPCIPRVSKPTSWGSARGTTCTHRLIGHRSRDSLLDAARCNVGVTIDVPLEAQEV